MRNWRKGRRRNWSDLMAIGGKNMIRQIGINLEGTGKGLD